MRPDDDIRIRHIVEAAEAARSFVEGRRRDDLDTDVMLRFALVRAIEIVGEAASKQPRDDGRRAVYSLAGDRRDAKPIGPRLLRHRP
jgi:uncharacterized protein with HEPN domain